MPSRTAGSKLVPEHEWDRQPDESTPAWRAFVVYRDMEDRTLQKVREVHGGAPSKLKGWSSNHDWPNRAAAYDAWKDKQAQLAEVQAIKDMKRRHINIAMSLQGTAALALQRLATIEKDPKAEVKLTAAEVKAFLELGTKIERLNRDMPDTITETRLPEVDKAAGLVKAALDPEAREALRRALGV